MMSTSFRINGCVVACCFFFVGAQAEAEMACETGADCEQDELAMVSLLQMNLEVQTSGKDAATATAAAASSKEVHVVKVEALANASLSHVVVDSQLASAEIPVKGGGTQPPPKTFQEQSAGANYYGYNHTRGTMITRVRSGHRAMAHACKVGTEHQCSNVEGVFSVIESGWDDTQRMGQTQGVHFAHGMEFYYTNQVISICGLGSWLYGQWGLPHTIQIIDSNHNHEISFDEMRAQMAPGADLAMARRMYNITDANHDGGVTQAEIVEFARTMIAVRQYVPDIDPNYISQRAEGIAIASRSGLESLLAQHSKSPASRVPKYIMFAIIFSLCSALAYWNFFREAPANPEQKVVY